MMIPARAALVAIAILIAGIAGIAGPPPAAQQTTAPPARDATTLPRGTATISGAVLLDAPDATPLRRVTLTLAGAELGPSRIAVSDDAGRFTFAALPAGRFTLTGARQGYVTAAYGAAVGSRSQGVAIAVANGETVGDITVRMTKGAVITGRVIDPHGRPVPDAAVVVGELRSFAGDLRFVAAPGPAEWTTDDRGVYRAYGLPPGSFIVSAQNQELGRRAIEPTPSAVADWVQQQSTAGAASLTRMPESASPMGYVPIYYPGTPDPAAAARLTIAAGEERDGVDITLRTVPYATVAGRVTLPGGAPAPGVSLFAFPIADVIGIDAFGIPPLGNTDAGGEFSVRSVPPGRYTLLARGDPPETAGRGAPPPQGPHGGSLWARAEITVDGRDLDGVSLQLLPGTTVSGRVTFENQPSPLPEDLRRTTVRIAPPPGAAGAFIRMPPAPIAADGTFTFADVGPGEYLVSASPPGPGDAPAWMPLAIGAGGRDLLVATLEVNPGAPVPDVTIALTDRVTTLSGTLQDAAGRPAPGYFVLAFPVDRRLWTLGADRLRPAVRASTDGRYRVTALLPGEYYVAALTEIPPNGHLDPLLLEQLVPAAIRLTIGVGEEKTQDLRLKTESGSVLRKS